MTNIPRQSPPPVAPGYEEVFITNGPVRLHAWLGRGRPSRAAVVLLPGLGDTVVGFHELADRLRARGHAVLLLDLRAHGLSEGKHTLGDREPEDVHAGLDFLRAQGEARSGAVLLGRSLGAMVAIRAAAGRPDVRGVVAEAPYTTAREAVANVGRVIYGVPTWVPFSASAIAVAEAYAGFDADHVDVAAAAGTLQAPLLAIVDEEDVWVPAASVRRIFDSHPGPKRFWVAPAQHAEAASLPEYERVLFAFFQEHGL